MSDGQGQALRVVRAGEVSSETAQSAGALRQSGIDRRFEGVSRIWLGKVSNEPVWGA